MRGHQLPAELFCPVFQNLGKKDLCILARACHTTQAEAESLIYRNIMLDTQRFIIEFCKLICKTPQLQSHIRVLCLNPGLAQYWGANKWGLSGYPTLVSLALSHMTFLRALTIWFNVHFPSARILE
jgi:hypothetical protein